MYSNQSPEEYYQGQFAATLHIIAELRQKGYSKEKVIEALYKNFDQKTFDQETENLLNYFAICDLMPKTINEYKNKEILFNYKELTTSNFLHDLEFLLQEVIADKPEYYKQYLEHLMVLSDCGFYPDSDIIKSFSKMISEKDVSYKELLTQKLFESVDNLNRTNTILSFQESESFLDNYLITAKINDNILLFDLLNNPQFKYNSGVSDFLKQADVDYLLNLSSCSGENILITLLKIVNVEYKNRSINKGHWSHEDKARKDTHDVIRKLLISGKDIGNYKDHEGNNIACYISQSPELLDLFEESVKKIENYQSLFFEKNKESICAYDILRYNNEKTENVLSLIIELEKYGIKDKICSQEISKRKINRL